MFSLDGLSKLIFFSKYVMRAIPNFLTQSICIHSGSYSEISIPAQLHYIVKFQNHLKKGKIAN